MTNTFVVLDLVCVPVGLVVFPLLELWYREEADLLLGLGGLDDGRDELLQERLAQQRRPVVVDEVDQQALDVRAVLWGGQAAKTGCQTQKKRSDYGKYCTNRISYVYTQITL